MDFQNAFKLHEWGPVRIIKCWSLLLVEEGLALYLGLANTPSQGYKLAANYCQNYDGRYGNSLNGPSRAKVLEIAQFLVTIEAAEERAGNSQ